MAKRLAAGSSVLAIVLLLAGCAAAPPPLSQATRVRLAAELVDAQWASVARDYPEAVRPPVPQTRVLPDHDWAIAVVDCLRKEGHVADLSGNGFAYHPFTGEAPIEYSVSGYLCTAASLKLSDVLAHLTRRQVDAFDDFEVNQVMPCLRAAGAATFLPPAGHLRGVSSWSPFDFVWLTGSAESAAYLELRCPPIPYWLDLGSME